MVDTPLVTLKRLTELWGPWQPPEEACDLQSRPDSELDSLSEYTAHFAAFIVPRAKPVRDSD